MAPVGATAAPAGHHHHHHHPKPHHPNGFFVGDRNANVQKVESFGTPSALVRDSNGTEHLVTTKPTSADPTMGHIEYGTRATDKDKWKIREVPVLRNLTGGVQVESHLSFNGRRIFAIFYECDGVFVVDAPIGAGRLPEPTEVASADTCSAPVDSTDNPPVARAGTVSGRTIEVMLPDPAQGGAEAIFSGVPTEEFTPGTALPTTDDFTPLQVAMDPTYGGIVVVGTGSDGTNEGIYAVRGQAFSDTWTDPEQIATLNSPTSDYKIDSLQNYNHHTFVGLEKPGASLSHSLFLVKGQPSGQWLGAVPLPHTAGHDHNLRLVVNTDTHHLHAAWTRVIASSHAKKSGIMHEGQSATGWLKPTFVSHWYRDVPTQITLTSAGHPYIGFNQR
jgi:hypothetical protein